MSIILPHQNTVFAEKGKESEKNNTLHGAGE